MSAPIRSDAASATETAALTHSTASHRAATALRIIALAALMCAAAGVGRIPVPGTVVGITLQTFVLMIAGLTMSPVEAGAGALLYLAIGACGAPVFSGGASTAALIGPSAGFLFGFVPAVIVTALLAPSADSRRSSRRSLWRDTLRSLVACTLGCILVPFAVGVTVQSLVTGVDIRALAAASSVFFVGDAIKAATATLLVTAARAARK
ncbi:biotin transporter BioY [Pseudoscardovia radai]|uniref:biotin transporter BioY n=1 Tax=Pseudoscardovia radai TaxID=987066 RepID=UPI003995D9EE